MPQISYVKYLDVLEARRFDAEYFKPEYLKIERILQNNKFISLKEISARIFRNPMMYGFSYVEKKQKGFPFIRIDDLNNPFIELERCEHISKDINEKYDSTQLMNGDVVMGVRGNTIGRLGIYKGNDNEANISPNVILFRLKNKNFSNFVALYLLSKYGKLQIERMLNGTGQPTITSVLLNDLKIPVLLQSFQFEIEEIVKSAFQKQTQSKEFYEQAEELLLEELGLLDYKIKKALWFTANKKEVDEARRFDAEYFQPKYQEIIEKIEQYEGGWDLVGKMVDWKKGFEVGAGAYAETGKDFVRVADFSVAGIASSSKKISEQVFENLKENYQPQKREILFTKDGTIGTSYVLKEEIDGILSGAFLRLNLKGKYKSFEKECLALIFNSILCKMQVEKLSGGALIAHLKPSDFETFKIPLIKSSIQQKISEKIQLSHQLRKESKELLEKAKRKVEEEIEKGDKK